MPLISRMQNKKVEGLFYICSENKGTDQLRGYCAADLYFCFWLIQKAGFLMRGRGGLVVNTSDSGSRGRGFKPHSGHCVVSLSKTYLPPKVLVIPRKQWLHPNMTVKFIKQKKKKGFLMT